MKHHLPAFLLAISTATFLTGCDVKVNNPPGGDTTIVNPPAEKNTTIINPPAEKKTETTTTVGPGSTTTEKKTETR